MSCALMPSALMALELVAIQLMTIESKIWSDSSMNAAAAYALTGMTIQSKVRASLYSYPAAMIQVNFVCVFSPIWVIHGGKRMG